jgi:RNA polymerase sigma-70 factor (ECF subfamily)
MSRERFEALLSPRLKGLRALVRRRLNRFGEVEDVVQEILLRAYVRRHQLRSEDSFGAWLWSIALNEVRAYYRSDRRMLSLDELPNFDVQDEADSPVAVAEQTEVARWVRECIAKLPKRDRAAIGARDLQEKTFRDAAAALRRTLPATKTAHFRARRRLADIMRSDVGRCPRLAA